jgi:hypothetical protein
MLVFQMSVCQMTVVQRSVELFCIGQNVCQVISVGPMSFS